MKTLLKSDYQFISGADAIDYRLGPIGAAIGAGVGAATYAYSQHMAGQPITGNGLLGHAVVGAVSGVLSPAPIRFIWGINSQLAYNIGKGVAHNIGNRQH